MNNVLETSSTFELNPTQYKCFLKVKEGHRKHERHIGFFGGVGAGKTFFGALAAWTLCLENPGESGFIVAHDLKPLENEILPAFLKLVPQGWVLNHSKKNRYLDLVGSRRVYYGTAKNWEALESYTVAWCWGDEVRYWVYKAFIRLQARVRSKTATLARCVWTSTPERNWMFREFAQGKKGRIYFTASTEENVANLDEFYFDDLKSSLSQANFDTYVGGQFHSAGTGLFLFDPEQHVKSGLYDDRLPVDVCIDFGVRSPHVLFCQYRDYDYDFQTHETVRVIDEIVAGDGSHTSKLAGDIKEHIAKKGYRLGNIYCDPAGRARDQASGMTSIHLIHRMLGKMPKYTTDPNRTLVANGIDLMNKMLAPYQGQPTLYFEAKLAEDATRGICNALTYAELPMDKSGNPTSDNYKKEGYYEHALDCCRYYLVNLIRPPSLFYRVT